jgi:hypothetical protein
MTKMKYPALIQAVAEELRTKGFKQRALCFNRPGADSQCTEVVTLKRRILPLAGKFTIELGIYVPRVRAIAYPDLSLPSFPQALSGRNSSTVSVIGLAERLRLKVSDLKAQSSNRV